MPTRAYQISAHHRFDGQRAEFLYHHGSAGQLHALVRVGDYIFHFDIGEVVGHQVPCFLEPEQRDLGQDLPFERDGVRHHDVESREAIGGDDQQMLGIHVVDITHLALMNLLETP